MDKSLINLKNRFKYLNLHLNKNEYDIRLLEKQQLSSNTVTHLKKLNYINIDTTQTLYDLYNFTGITYSVSTESPEPADAYTEDNIPYSDLKEYYFRYPITGFPVPFAENPADYSSGATDWEKRETIAITHTFYHFNNLPEEFVKTSNLICYLSTENNATLPNLTVMNNNEVYTQYNYFYRWIKNTENNNQTPYTLEFFALIPRPEGIEINLTAKLYLRNSREFYVSQSTKIQSE